MGDTDKVLAKAPGGLKMSPQAWERWRAVTLGLACYCICSAYLRARRGLRGQVRRGHSRKSRVRARGLSAGLSEGRKCSVVSKCSIMSSSLIVRFRIHKYFMTLEDKLYAVFCLL